MFSKFKIEALVLLSVMVMSIVSFDAIAFSLYSKDTIMANNTNLVGDVGMYEDETNYGVEKFSNFASQEDVVLAKVYISDYRKGRNTAEDDLKKLICKYNSADANLILNYMLNDFSIFHMGHYSIDIEGGTLRFLPIEAFNKQEDPNATYIAKLMIESLKKYAPDDIKKHIREINVEKYRDHNNLATIYSIDGNYNDFCLNFDTTLLNTGEDEKLKDNIIYVTTFYYLLRQDQIERLLKRSDNYKFGGNTYADLSYINVFYKRFWSGRRKETHESQFDSNKKEFFSPKASYSVYDDMAASFAYYVKNGMQEKLFGYKFDKRNFFDSMPLFRDLAVFFRNTMGY